MSDIKNKELLEQANKVVDKIVDKIGGNFERMRIYAEEFTLANDLLEAEAALDYLAIEQLLEKYNKIEQS